ncbi:MAG: Glutamate--tRNA ligase [Bacteroidota bacterium]
MKEVRVRFAPSPTGALHIGGIRTALYNYLFAKQHNGTFYLRIEDTDQTRHDPNAEQYIYDALAWLGISPDETVNKNERFAPYRQSERTDIYKEHVDTLVQTGHAYYAFDSTTDLENERTNAENAKMTFVYNHSTRIRLQNSFTLSNVEVQTRLQKNEPFVIRFKNPENETLSLHDLIRGDVTFETSLLDDKILYKSDGMPTYHFANVVDDHLMQTSHVIRGEEWLPSLPLHYMLYRSFGWTAPIFAHLPLILKPIGNGKLSKRDGEKLGFPVFPLAWNSSLGYREQGYFPEAVINFLALLGWNDGTEKEIFSVAELIEKFDLHKVHKSGAKFNPEKNKWFNHQYMQQQDNEKLAALFSKIVAEKGYHSDIKKLTTIVSKIKDRANFVNDFWQLSSYLFEPPQKYEDKALKNWTSETTSNLRSISTTLTTITNFTSKNIESTVQNWSTTHDISTGKIMPALRLALVGSLTGINVFDIIEIIGKDDTITRLHTATTAINS